MTLTDDDLRAAVAARVALAPEPLTPELLRERWERLAGAAQVGRRGGAARLLVAAAAVVLVAGAGVVLGTRGTDPGPGDDAPIPPSGATVGRYFVPAVLPPSYELLSFTEQPGDPDQGEPARSVWRHRPTGHLVALSVADPFVDESPNTLPLDGGGTARWTDPPAELPAGMTRVPIGFTVERVDGFVTGTATSDIELPVLREMLAAVYVEDGLPVVVDDDFELVSSRPEVAAPVAATWTATYGPRGGYTDMGGLQIIATRASAPIDLPLELGVWTESVERDGRTIHTGIMGMSPQWFVSDDVSVRAVGDGQVVGVDVLAGLVEIDVARLVDEVIPSIEPDASNMPLADRIEFADGIVGEFFGDRDSPRGVCLDVDGRRRCDLALRSRANFADDRSLLEVDVDLLVSGRWFTVGIRVDPPPGVVNAPVPVGAERVDQGDRIYYLVERPADAAVVPGGGAWSGVRPSR